MSSNPNKMEAVIQMANTVLDSQQHRIVPDWILKGCKGVVIVSSMEIAFIVSGGGGDGVIIKHNEDGTWGAPAAITMNFVGAGINFGMAEKHVLLYPMTEKGLESLTSNAFKCGVQVGIAAGPVGREAEVAAEASSKGADLTYSYIFDKGAFVTGGISGSVIHQDVDANKNFYGGSDASPTDIVMKAGAVTIPEGKGVEDLHQKLTAMTSSSEKK